MEKNKIALVQKENIVKYLGVTLKILAIIFALVYFIKNLNRDYFDINIITMKEIVPVERQRIMFALLRMLNCGLALVVILAPFFDNKLFKKIICFIAPVFAIINFVLINPHMLTINGPIGQIQSFQGYLFILMQSLILLISLLSNIVLLLSPREKYIWKNIWKESLILVIIVLLSFLNAPTSSFTALFIKSNWRAQDVNLVHRLLMYGSLVVPLIIFMLMKKKSYSTRYLLCMCMALAAVYTYFYQFHYTDYLNVTQYPFHLCNAAVILMLIAFVFRSKPFFYFNYLVNVLGALIAIYMPVTTGDLFRSANVHFWYNHLLVVMLPLLGCALKIFPRPTFKYVGYSLAVFTGYFIVVAGLNALNPFFIDRFGSSVNYFFLNEDNVTSVLTFLEPLRINGVMTFTIFGLPCKAYPLYWAIVYFGYCGLAVGMWFLYKILYKIEDQYADIAFRRKKYKFEQKLLKEQANIFKKEEETNMLQIEHFTKRYGKSDRLAVDDFSLEVKTGEIFGFLGHNGAGKSTVIKCVIGMQPITGGTIKIFGHDVAKEPLKTKLLVGFVPDNHAIYEGLTGREYVNYIADLFLVSTEDRKVRLRKYAERFSIIDALDRPIKSYSHGMKQKITIIAALIHDPKVWILDEPLTGLDPTSCFQIKECMKEHAARGNIVFFSSHVIEVVENICDRICVISHGKLKCVHALKDLKAKNIRLEDIYLQYVQNAHDEELERKKKELANV